MHPRLLKPLNGLLYPLWMMVNDGECDQPVESLVKETGVLRENLPSAAFPTTIQHYLDLGSNEAAVMGNWQLTS
jgi:hypothetical protein